MYVCIGHLGWLNAERLKEFRNQFKWWPKALRNRVWLRTSGGNQRPTGLCAEPRCGFASSRSAKRQTSGVQKSITYDPGTFSDGEGAMNDLTQQMQSQLGLENKSLGSSPN